MQKIVLLLLLAAGTTGLYAQNVGIGTITPDDGRLVVVGNTSNQFLSRISATGPGISFYTPSGSPTLGFNSFLKSGYSYIGNGYGSFFQYDTATGNLKYFSSVNKGTANTGMVTTTTTLFTFSRAGFLGIGVSDPDAGLHVRGKTLLVDNASGFSSILLTPTTTAVGGLLELKNNTGIRTVALRSGDGSGISGELIFYDNTGVSSSLELDGDYAATGRSRIIVDELQIRGGADFAENFDVAPIDGVKPEAGMLVSIDDKNEGKLVVSNTTYDKKVAGVISGANGIKPGMMMGHKNTIANGSLPVAITGRVYVKAEALNSAINPGDLLTTSAIAGHAMKAANTKKATGTIIGKAMTGLQKGKQGMVLVLLSIQ